MNTSLSAGDCGKAETANYFRDRKASYQFRSKRSIQFGGCRCLAGLVCYAPVLTVKQLREIARERIKDAEALFDAERYEGAMYICGYAMEIALKARVCKTLRWSDFPQTDSEFGGKNRKYAPFKTHALDFLLSYSGREDKIRNRFKAQWDLVVSWDPQSRYTPPLKTTRATRARDKAALKAKTRQMIDSVKILLREL
ncbi:MAG: HEPN domain-containing protein [Blastocatellia bacterium]|nr:HEPN domain-containing protein [Blastocatellia bacterium]